MFFVHPQIQLKDLLRALTCFFKKLDKASLVQKLSFYFPGKQFIFTDMGRTAFRVTIEKLNLQNSEIILPAYICDIFLPIFQRYNVKPIFLDIDLKTFNIKIDELQKKLTPVTKAILVCHTYGLPVDIEKIKAIFQAPSSPLGSRWDPIRSDPVGILRDPRGMGSQRDKLQAPIIIEDCAHSFGARKEGLPFPTGEGQTFLSCNSGDVAFFSLYKQFPTLRGGLLVCPKNWQVDLPKTHFNFRDFISFLNCFPFFAYLFKRFAGRVAPKMLREEKLAEPAGINRASLNLFSAFLDDFEKSIENRQELALFFQEELKNLGFEVQESRDNIFCYLSALVPESLREKRDEIVRKLRKYKIFATRIWHTPIILNPEAQKEYQIDLGQFPNTLEAAKRIINFPLQNHYNKTDIKKMIRKIKKLLLDKKVKINYGKEI